MDLTRQGFLANVQCGEVWCPMTREFFKEYISPAMENRRGQLLYILNPNVRIFLFPSLHPLHCTVFLFFNHCTVLYFILRFSGHTSLPTDSTTLPLYCSTAPALHFS